MVVANNDKLKKTKVVAVRFDETAYEKIEKAASDKGHKVAAFIRYATEQYIREQEENNNG